ncbi:porin family protein [Legionella israelensis]|uniref:Porin family protein n=1 Tax=Legionella israelensis TaxID=454 RepID=A0AAX1EIU7_9GAMM|nr:porin family protein [Legionella israelensis]QBR85076.1 porin family protein [Legionella israelensis]
MNKKLSFLAFFTSLPLYAGAMGEVVPPDYPWFASIGTGYSWTEKPGIKNPDPAVWDPAIQGYDASLGDRGFYTFAIGKQVHQYVDISVSYLNHEVFDYQKFQSGALAGQPGFTGNERTRFFRLSNRALLVNGFLHPNRSWANFLGIELMPFVGGGIGFSHNEVRDFHTIGNIVVAGIPIGSTSSIGKPSSKNSFSWQGSLGLNFRPAQSHLSVDIGYRYFDGGKFEGSSLIYTNSAGWLSAPPWRGRLKANQGFVEFKYSA